METAVFVAGALVCLLGAVGLVTSDNPVHAALSLVGTLIGIAVLFIAQDAEFLAAVQVIVYAGAIVVLFLFVIMLLGPSASTPVDRRGHIPRILGASLFGMGRRGFGDAPRRVSTVVDRGYNAAVGRNVGARRWRVACSKA